MSNSIVICWDRPVPGREKNANELFNMASSYFDKNVKDGVLKNWEPVLLSAHGGTLNGFMFLRGDPKKLNDFTMTGEFRDLVVKCGINLKGFGVIRSYVGEEVTDMMRRWTASL